MTQHREGSLRSGAFRDETAMKIVVDKPLTGWKDLREEDLLKTYDEVRKVGQYPGLPQRSDDKELGVYCKRENCAFLTPDIGAYTHFLEAGINAVKISRYGHDKKSDQRVYLIEIVE